MRRVLSTEPTRPPVSRWLVRLVVLGLLALTVGWMTHEPDWARSPIEGLGSLRVMGLTEGRVHEVPGMTGLLDQLPDAWRDSAARQLGYQNVAWKIAGPKEEVLVWCEWKLAETLPPGGWFEPVLVGRDGKPIAQGNYPAVGYVPGRHIEPIRFPVTHVEPGTVLQIRRFQPGSPYRDLIAKVTLPEF